MVVSGMVAGVPGQGGATWAVLQYLLGLRRLGHSVTLVEPITVGPGPELVDTPAAAYCSTVMAAAGLDGDWALLEAGSRRTAGLDYDELLLRAQQADVLVNVSGMLTDEALLEEIPVRAYLDLDPVFNQLWQTQGIDMRMEGHTHFVTVGQALGTDACRVPTCDRHWIPSLPPVVLEEWPVGESIRHQAFTTIANLRGYGSITHDGVAYGQKVHSLRELAGVPTGTTERFVVAMAVHPDERRDREMLEVNGWELVDPATVAATPDDYRCFVRGSKAEIGVAKAGYVVSRSGWFSDRSACYLASGRPVVAQDTGFPAFVPTGEGLLSFATADEAVDAVETVAAHYDRHRRAARDLAQEHLDSDRILARLLDRLGAA